MPLNQDQLTAIAETILHALPAIFLIVVAAILIHVVLGRILNAVAEAEPGVVYQIPDNLFFQKTLKRRHDDAPISLVEQLRSNIPQEPQAKAQAKPRSGKR